MNEEFKYCDADYDRLQDMLNKSNQIAYGRPDQFQFYQNELSKAVAYFLLLPYYHKKLMEKGQPDEK